MRPRAQLLALLLTTGAFSVLSSCGGEPGSPLESAEYLVENPERIVQLGPNPSVLKAPFVEIGYDRRRALFQHPPSTYRIAGVEAGSGASFRAAPALAPQSWEHTDGASFEALCVGPQGGWKQLLSVHLEPDENAAHRDWQDQEVSLAACADSTTLELRTTCGRSGDCRWDTAYWGEPRVVRPRSLPRGINRLVLLISIDTLRPDRLELYGAERPTTPLLGELAGDSVVFETAIAPAPWTVPSHASLLTSTDPEVHGATTERDIHPSLSSIAEVFNDAGWTTAGFVDTPWLGTPGFSRGFEHFDAQPPPEGSSIRGAAITRESLLRFLESTEGDIFLFWHIMDAHGPYGAPAPFGGRFRNALQSDPEGRLEDLAKLSYHDYLQLGRFRSLADLIASYDEGVAYVDSQVGDLLEVLKQSGLYEKALIAVTSDHGESFMDHGVWVGHGLFLTDDEIRVPLIIKLPENRYAGRRVAEMVRLIDVAPTILDDIGLPAPDTFHGQSLASPAPGERGALPRMAFGVSSNTGARYARDNRAKLITSWSKPRQRVVETHLRPQESSDLVAKIKSGEQLYDLVSDPEETVNLLSGEGGGGAAIAEELGRLLSRREAWLANVGQRLESTEPDAVRSEEETRRLRALGYLGGEN